MSSQDCSSVTQFSVTGVSQATSDVTIFRFMALPLELRLVIYEYLAPKYDDLFASVDNETETVNIFNVEFPGLENEQDHLAILRCSQAIYKEARDVIWAKIGTINAVNINSYKNDFRQSTYNISHPLLIKTVSEIQISKIFGRRLRSSDIEIIPRVFPNVRDVLIHPLYDWLYNGSPLSPEACGMITIVELGNVMQMKCLEKDFKWIVQHLPALREINVWISEMFDPGSGKAFLALVVNFLDQFKTRTVEEIGEFPMITHHRHLFHECQKIGANGNIFEMTVVCELQRNASISTQ